MRRTFQRQIHRIEDRRVQLGVTRQSCSSDREAISAGQRTHTQSVALIESMKRQSVGWCRRVEEDVAALTSVMEVLYPVKHPAPAPTPTPASDSGTEGAGAQDGRALQAMRDRLADVEASLILAIKSEVRITIVEDLE